MACVDAVLWNIYRRRKLISGDYSGTPGSATRADMSLKRSLEARASSRVSGGPNPHCRYTCNRVSNFISPSTSSQRPREQVMYYLTSITEMLIICENVWKHCAPGFRFKAHGNCAKMTNAEMRSLLNGERVMAANWARSIFCVRSNIKRKEYQIEVA